MDNAANKEFTIEVTCPGCRGTSTVLKTRVGDFLPCPQCGMSIEIDCPDELKELEKRSPFQRACTDQREASRDFRETQGLLRVEFRVFRLQMWSDWETLFKEATDFANRLAPEALINISHSGGKGHGTNAVTVWYWRKQSADE